MEIKLESLSEVKEMLALVRNLEREQMEELRGVLARARLKLQNAIQRAQGEKR